MSAIATGYLKVETFAENKGEVLANVMIRIYKIEAQEIVFEDFFMTKQDGATQLIPLYAPSKAMTMTLNQESPPYEQYYIEANFKGYQTYKLSGIQIFADEISNIRIKMETFDGDKEICEYDLEHHQRFLNPIPSINLMAWNSKKKVKFPEQITLYLEGKDSKSITISFLEYLENCACSELFPTWPKKVLEINVILLMTRMLGYLNDKKNVVSTNYGIHYIPNQVLFQSVLNVVDEMYGYVLCTSEVSQNTFINLDYNWDPWMLLNPQYSMTSNFEKLQTYLKTPIKIQKLFEKKNIKTTFNEKNLTKQKTKKEVVELQKQLRKISTHYKNIPICGLSSQYDDETRNVILAFQRMLGIQDNTIKTAYLIQKVYEELEEEHR